MSPNGRNDDMLTVDMSTTQSTGGYLSDDESQFEWNDTLCILRPSDEERPQRFISIDDNHVDVREMDKIFGPKLDNDKIFFKLRVGTKPGSSWCKVLDWELEDYEKVLNNHPVMYKLEHGMTPNPTYIQEMKSNLRELKINKVIEDDTNG